MMSVSVVIPVFNGGSLVGDAIRSALGQTLAPAEVIVVDDGSTDDTAEVVRAFPTVRHMRVRNGGAGRARNKGVAASSGEWIAFCDHDDLWRPDYLASFAACVTAHSTFGFCNFVDVVDGRWTDRQQFSGLKPDFFANLGVPLYRNLVDHNPIWPSATMIRRKFFDQIGRFNPRFSRFATEDLEFTLRCNEYANPVVMRAPLVGIRKHGGNYSKGRVRQLLSDAAILEWSSDHHRLGRVFRQHLVEVTAARRSRALDEAFMQGDMARVRDVARLIPAPYLTSKTKLKIALAQSRVVPGAILRAAIGRPLESCQVGTYATAPATSEEE